MPKHPESRYRARVGLQAAAWPAAGLLALVVSGCAAGPEASNQTEQPPAVLQQIASRLPGDYVSVRDEDRPTQSLTIDQRSARQADAVAFSLIQAGRDDGSERRYGLELAPGALDNRLDGRFALLGPDGRERRSCPMAFHLTDRGLVGETAPDSCRFGDGNDAVGLLKELTFDGMKIRIGDRLVDPETGEPRGRDRVIHFLPVRPFNGWLGVREGDQWRIARDVRLTPGSRVEPRDAAEMSLGVAIALDYYRMERGDSGPILRLTVTDKRSGEVIAESWTGPKSGSIGVALPDLQVGLSIAE
jgi:hypothetical protein